MEFKNKCPSTNIHLIAHSLGASVIDSALVILDINTNWNAKIATVHLLGAAINNQLISNNTLLGNATENVVNYKDIDISYEIPPISDADGDSNSKECFENIQPSHLWGNNHCGYIGFRNSTSGALIDDGVMNMVVRNLVK
jgi:hypothetical protein